MTEQSRLGSADECRNVGDAAFWARAQNSPGLGERARDCIAKLNAQAAAPKTNGRNEAAGDKPPVRQEGKIAGDQAQVEDRDGKPKPAEAGADIGAGDTVTATEKPVAVNFDGAKAELDANAQLKVREGEPGHVEHRRGRIFYSIVDRRMTVHVPTPRGEWVINNRGTRFSVDIAEDGSGRIRVEEGSVVVSSAGTAILVETGESSRVTPGASPVFAGNNAIEDTLLEWAATVTNDAVLFWGGVVGAITAAFLVNRIAVRILRSRRHADP